MNRLKEMSIAIWNMLTEEEKVGYYCGMGTIGFVEDVSGIIGFDLDTLTEDEFDEILAQLFNDISV